jgi:hypothetical protein
MGILTGVLGSIAGGLVNKVLGNKSSDTGQRSGGWLSGVGTAVLGGATDRYFDRKARDDQFNYLRSQGLTPVEIAGSGFGDGRASGGQAVLGNQMAQQEAMQRQQDYDREQRALDRAVAIRAQDTGLAQSQLSAQATLGAASMSSDASRYSSDTQRLIAEGRLAIERDRFDKLELPKGLNDIVTSSPDWKRQQLLATMGVDNMIATVIAGARGIDIMDPDTLEAMTDEQFRDLVIQIYGLQSTIFRESAGPTTIIDNAINSLRDTLGRN